MAAQPVSHLSPKANNLVSPVSKATQPVSPISLKSKDPVSPLSKTTQPVNDPVSPVPEVNDEVMEYGLVHVLAQLHQDEPVSEPQLFHHYTKC
jgi:hypothetical protein